MIRSFAWLAALVSAFAPVTLAAQKQPKVGAPAPEFELKLIDDSRVRLSELRGQVVVLNFWATWCAPCKKELPLLDAFYRKLGRHGLKVYAITTESSLPIFKLKPLFEKMAIPSAKSVKGPYGDVTAVPYNVVIDRAGQIRYAKAGAFDVAALNTIVIPLLNEPVPAD